MGWDPRFWGPQEMGLGARKGQKTFWGPRVGGFGVRRFGVSHIPDRGVLGVPVLRFWGPSVGVLGSHVVKPPPPDLRGRCGVPSAEVLGFHGVRRFGVS